MEKLKEGRKKKGPWRFYELTLSYKLQQQQQQEKKLITKVLSY